MYSAISALSTGLTLQGCSEPEQELTKVLALPETLSQTYDEKTIRQIGKAFAKAFPDQYNINDLEQVLKKRQDGNIIPASIGTVELRSILEQQVKQDFQSGQTIILDGIILSLTEARQCALFTLIAPTN